jgi:hypothetical protein
MQMSGGTGKAYHNALHIDQGGKGIPYGGAGEPRPDGGANYGFKNLKGDLSLVDDVPELKSDDPLRSLVLTINAPESGLFSVGCLGADCHEAEGYRRTGYIEFAYNSKTGVADAANYFPLFFHFDRHLLSSQFQAPVRFDWEFQGAQFIDAQIGGFTSTIYLNTEYCGSGQLAQEAWASGLAALEAFLSKILQQPGEPIY